MRDPISAADGPPRVAIVVPTFDERESLPLLVDAITMQKIPQLRIVVVDDNSPDGTGAEADRLARDPRNHLSVVHRRRRDGLGRAYVAGMQHALEGGADVIVQMDADLSHSPADLPVMLDALRSPRVGVVIGSRYVPGGTVDVDWPRRRRWLSRAANRYVNKILHLGVADATSGFRAWRGAALDMVGLETIRNHGYAFQVEMAFRAARAGWPIVELPITFTDRRHGRSKMTICTVVESAFAPWRLRFTADPVPAPDFAARPRSRLTTYH
jgi:dolichol-phosphate mannosyltransferase